MKLTVRAEVMGGAILQQVFIVEYTIANQMCDDCHRSEAQDYWRALVIFLFLLLKSSAKFVFMVKNYYQFPL